MLRCAKVPGARKAKTNLKQIALAMHNYHDTYGTFPPHAIYSKDGKPLLSWRVMILPYIEQNNLYQQFHLDEPWDSEHNQKLMQQMPRPTPRRKNSKFKRLGEWNEWKAGPQGRHEIPRP